MLPVMAGHPTANLEMMEAVAKTYNAHLLHLARRVGPIGARVLDFGAGIGTFARALATEGRRMICIERDRTAREALIAAGFEVYQSLESLPRDHRFDGCLAFNVLAIVSDDAALLREFRSHLRPKGTLLLYVPAFALLFSSFDRHIGHLRRYRLASLVKIVEAAGFEVCKAWYVDSLGFLLALFYRLVGPRTGKLDPNVLLFFDRVIFPLSLICDRLFKNLFGKNIFIEARRL